MSLPAAATLSQVRDEVFTRCTLNTGGDRGARALKMVDSQIRRAQRELVIKCGWLRLQSSVTVTLVSAITTYDFPDSMAPGRYMDVFVRDVSSGKYYQMEPDPTQNQRNSLGTATSSRPMYYWFNDGQLQITPPPNPTYWDVIRIDGYLRETDLVSDTDLVAVDFEAIVQRAELFVRPRIGLAVTQDMKDSHLAYVRDVRALQSENGNTMAGGDTSIKCMPQEGSGLPRNGFAWDASWMPPGTWGPG